MNTASANDQREIAQMQNAQPADYPETAELRRWFGLTESMTAAVAHHFRGKASVTLLGEGKEAANQWECDVLNTVDDVYARHISLTVDGVPRLIARSLTTPEQAVVELMQGLGERPLAELLFTDPQWVRDKQALYLHTPSGLPGRAVLWCHQVHQQRLLVEEFFLPALLQTAAR